MIQRIWYATLRVVSQLTFTLFYRIRVTGRHHVPADGPVIILSSHQSFMDPVIMGLGLPRQLHYMAKASLFGHSSLFSALMTSLNGYPVKQGENDLGAIKETIRRVRGGNAVVIFGEGSRTEDGEILPIQAGALLVAKKCAAPLVPAVIEGAFDAWPRHQKLPMPGHIRVAFGRPIPAAEIAATPADRMTEVVKERLLEMQSDLRRRIAHSEE